MKKSNSLLYLVIVIVLIIGCILFGISQLKQMDPDNMWKTIAVIIAVIGFVLAFIGHSTQSDGLGGLGESILLIGLVGLGILFITNKQPTKMVQEITPLEFQISIPNYDRLQSSQSELFIKATIVQTEETSEFTVGSFNYNAPKGILVIFLPQGADCSVIPETNALVCNGLHYDINYVLGLSGKQKNNNGYTLPYIVPCRTGIDQYQGTFCESGNYILVR